MILNSDDERTITWYLEWVRNRKCNAMYRTFYKENMFIQTIQ